MPTKRRLLTASPLVANCGRCGVSQSVIMPVDDFRCETCAIAEVDENATEETRAGIKYLIAGAVMIVIAVLMGMAGWNPLESRPSGDYDGGSGMLPAIVFGGIGLAGLGFGAFRFRPNLYR